MDEQGARDGRVEVHRLGAFLDHMLAHVRHQHTLLPQRLHATELEGGLAHQHHAALRAVLDCLRVVKAARAGMSRGGR